MCDRPNADKQHVTDDLTFDTLSTFSHHVFASAGILNTCMYRSDLFNLKVHLAPNTWKHAVSVHAVDIHESAELKK